MFHNRRLEIIAIVAVLAFIAIFIVTSTIMPYAKFSGSDEEGSTQISSLTGIPEENFTPLIPQWVPPSGEIEAALFGIQAAVGGIILGFVFGYWIGRKKDTSD
jgi:cobalt/nickel transport protein